MIVSAGKQVILLSVLAASPVVWFNVNEIGHILDLIRLGQYPELLKLVKQPERVLRFFFSTGLTCLFAGACYLSLPLKFFIGWLPFLGRIDDFIAKSFVSGGFLSLGFAFFLQNQI